MYQKSRYVVQTRKDNQTEWWDLEAPIAVDGNEDSLLRALRNMKQENELFPDDEHRVIIRIEQQLA